ncbi:MAG: peptidylprolyl isomerase, partial [Proteobacteria bacterium]|nr:peptidylprolyl isomerase [Pseudomonadota bacterium]
LLEILSAEGESFESYKRDFRNQLILRKFQRRVIVPSVKITDKDIETYYLTQSTTASTELVEVVLRQITFNLQNTTSKALQNEKKALADEVFTKLKSGLDFSEAIGLYSDDAKDKNETRQQLSVKLVDLAPKIRDVVDPLKTNEFSNPVQIGNTIFIFQVVDRTLAINRDYEKKRQQLEQELRVIELKNQTNKWLSDQRQRIAIKFLDK